MTTDIAETIARWRERLRCVPDHEVIDLEVTGREASALLSAAENALRLQAENFALAANQCHDGYAGEHGHHMCREVERARDAALEEAEKVARRHADAGHLADVIANRIAALRSKP